MKFLDCVVIKIRVVEFLKLTHLWIINLLLFVLPVYLWQNKANFDTYFDNNFLSTIIIPLLLSLFITFEVELIKLYNKRCQWAEKRDSVYRDLLEIFTIIIVSIHRDFGNIFEYPAFRGLFDIERAKMRIQEMYNFAEDEKKFVTNNFYLHKVKENINYLANEYFSIISNSCTEEDIKYYYTILVTNLIKYKDDILQLNNKTFRDIARENAYMQIKNISEEMKYLYEKMYKYIKNILNKETKTYHRYNIQYYDYLMFGGIDNAN